MHLLAVPSREQLECLLSYMLDEDEFLSPYGIRSLSKVHAKYPYELELDGERHRSDICTDEPLARGNGQPLPICFDLK